MKPPYFSVIRAHLHVYCQACEDESLPHDPQGGIKIKIDTTR